MDPSKPKKGLFYAHGKNLFVGPWKRMWMEIPYMPFFGIQAVILATIAFYQVSKLEDGIGLQNNFVVFRPDDPLVKKIRSPEEMQPVARIML